MKRFSAISEMATAGLWCMTVCVVILAMIRTTYALDNRNDDLIFDATKESMSLVLPHDTYPGFNIQRISAAGLTTTSANLSSSSSASGSGDPMATYKLNKKYAKYFTVLENGMLMTTSDLSPLVNQPVNLVVVEETPNATYTHQLQLFVMNRKDMIRFPSATLEVSGEVMENKAAGTKVQGVPLLQANSLSGHKAISYAIIDGNEDETFTLQNSVTKEMRTTQSIKHGEKAGVWLVTNKPLDREAKNNYSLMIQATDNEGLDKALSRVSIIVLDDNDNRPIFTHPNFKFAIAGNKTTNLDGNATVTWDRFTKIGRIQAKDADGDRVAYKLLTPNNLIVIVPQTGELLLAGEPDRSELLLKVEAHDLRTPSLTSKKPVDVLVEFVAPDPVSVVVQHLEHDDAYAQQHSHRRDKRRVTRAVRPTKRIEFTEADGDTEGKSVFQLEKETDRETFKIRDENPWVTVEPNGAVRTKKKWDYEELGPEKTIDFWVIISNSGQSGKFYDFVFLFFVAISETHTENHRIILRARYFRIWKRRVKCNHGEKNANKTCEPKPKIINSIEKKTILLLGFASSLPLASQCAPNRFACICRILSAQKKVNKNGSSCVGYMFALIPVK